MRIWKRDVLCRLKRPLLIYAGNMAYESEPWLSRRMGSMPVDNFVVLYIPDDGKGTVTVIRVLYGGRDIDREMREYA